jgi:hypothetical protein
MHACGLVACGLVARPAVVVGTAGAAPANVSSASGWHSLDALGRVHRADSAFVLPMRRSDFGDYLGLSVQSVSRTFTTSKMRGSIELPRADHVKFVDIGELQSLANGDRHVSRVPRRGCAPTPK